MYDNLKVNDSCNVQVIETQTETTSIGFYIRGNIKEIGKDYFIVSLQNGEGDVYTDERLVFQQKEGFTDLLSQKENV